MSLNGGYNATKMDKKNIDISIVIACYNEMEHIVQSIAELTDFLDSTKLRYELIFVDDCSIDGTAQKIIDFSKKHKQAICYFHSRNVGRGGSVSEGLMKSNGRIVGFIDIDMEISPIYILPAYKCIEGGYDVVIAARRYNVETATFVRWILSRGYNYLARKLLKIPFADTEAGFKFFNSKKIIPILKETNDKKWFWDTEVLVRAYLAGYKIKELTALYVRNDKKTSTVRIFKDTKDYFISLIKFRREIKPLLH
ncbi:glycosyltransferase [Candidatus Woesearchaeota archaeon]|nr:glycosyltransferase [Candidatus Woesearchaeota archaeon]